MRQLVQVKVLVSHLLEVQYRTHDGQRQEETGAVVSSLPLDMHITAAIAAVPAHLALLCKKALELSRVSIAPAVQGTIHDVRYRVPLQNSGMGKFQFEELKHFARCQSLGYYVHQGTMVKVALVPQHLIPSACENLVV